MKLTNKFEIVRTLGEFIVPANYDHQTLAANFAAELGGLRQSTKRMLLHYDQLGELGNPEHIMLPGEKFRVHLLLRKENGDGVKDFIDLLLENPDAVCLGYQGIVLAWRHFRKTMNSFDGEFFEARFISPESKRLDEWSVVRDVYEVSFGGQPFEHIFKSYASPCYTTYHETFSLRKSTDDRFNENNFGIMIFEKI
jgi:hypothetical protein